MARDSLQMNVEFPKFRVNGDLKSPLLLSELRVNSKYPAPGMGTGDGVGGGVCILEKHTSVRELRCRILKSWWGRSHGAPAEGLSYNPALFCGWSTVYLCVRGRRVCCRLDIVTLHKGRRWLLGINAAQMLNRYVHSGLIHRVRRYLWFHCHSQVLRPKQEGGGEEFFTQAVVWGLRWAAYLCFS